MKTTRHYFKDAQGVKHEYVRILRINGNTIHGESISLARYQASQQDLGLVL